MYGVANIELSWAAYSLKLLLLKTANIKLQMKKNFKD